jgi:hypothetical protein
VSAVATGLADDAVDGFELVAALQANPIRGLLTDPGTRSLK